MGIIRNFIYGDPETQGMTYRIRVFDHGHHVKTATVKNRGQDRVELVVKPKDYGFLGTDTKLAFIINPDIKPRYFGNIMEIDFDVRDSTQLADIFDFCPDLVKSLNQQYYDTVMALRQGSKNNVVEAEFTEKEEKESEETSQTDDDPALTALTDPEEPKEKPIPQPGLGDTILLNIEGYRRLEEIRKAPELERQELVLKCLEFCSRPGNEKCLRWLPKHLHIDPEVTAIVSQTELDGVGIRPMYYIKQSAAEISEKMLARPKMAEDWKTTALYIIGILGVLTIFAFMVWKVTGG